MGYSLMKDISANVLPEVKATLPEDYAIEVNGRRYSKAFYPEPIAHEECFGDICNYSGYPDYWLGAFKACNKNLPSKADFSYDFFSYFYKFDKTSGDYVLDDEKISKAGFNLSNSNKLYLHEIILNSALIAYMPPVIPFNQTPEQFFKSSNAIEYVFSIDGATHGDWNAELRQVICLLSLPPSICEKIKDWYNIESYDCTISDDIIQSAATSGNFAEVTPNIVLLNGLKLYIGSDYEYIEELSDAESDDDRTGFVIYIDVNGDSGAGELWEDVFPFYLLGSGKVLPAYNEETPSGGNTKENLSVNVIYDSYSGETREVKLLMTDTNFRSAACATGYIKSEKYCGDKVQYDLCKKDYHDCRMMVKEPIKIF